MGNAAAGMCIDSYGGLQTEVTAIESESSRMGFLLPGSGTSIGADTIGLLRGSAHRQLAVEFIEFVLSEQGQKLWSFRRGVPGGPLRHALHRAPILPGLYAPAFDQLRSDPAINPYGGMLGFVYHDGWTRRLYRDISFVVRVLCVDPAPELAEAYQALAVNGFPADATALFDDVAAVDYDTVSTRIHGVLGSGDAVAQMDLAGELVGKFRAQYRRVTELARSSHGAR
jgi:ABC-type glycerol-3-phosphate transport system substrate-binding protein